VKGLALFWPFLYECLAMRIIKGAATARTVEEVCAIQLVKVFS